MSSRFDNHIHHLLVELQRIDGLIREYVANVRSGWHDGDYQGLFISEQEIDELLTQPLFKSERHEQIGPDLEFKTNARKQIDSRIETTLAAGGELRLPHLNLLFDLSPIEIDVLLICLAIELDLRYERLYAYAQDDVTKKQPRVDLILNVLCPNLVDRLAARSIFLPTGSLLRYNLIELTDEPGQSYTPLLGRFVHIQRRILDFLLGLDEIDERLLTFCLCYQPSLCLSDLTLPEEIVEKVNGIAARWRENVKEKSDKIIGETLYLQGQYGSGRKAVSEALSKALDKRVLCVDIKRLFTHSDNNVVSLIYREALLQNSILLFVDMDACLGDDKDKTLLRESLLGAMEHFPGLVCISGETEWEPRGKLGKRLYMRLTLSTPNYATRAKLWKRQTGDFSIVDDGFSDNELEALANKFSFTAGQIQDAVIAARGLAAWRSISDLPTLEEFYAAARAQSTPILNTMARKINPRFGWKDIVLIPDSLDILHEISNTIKNRHIVLGQWGFQRKLATGLGLNVLFAGESGTGKTMAADILAGELGLDLYKIDLSGIISKYIGETEKNLDRIFSEAKTSNAILFFDEADAVFGKRSEVRDSHDRYANIEISYLLQKMEEYDGVVILATNLRSNIDDAFVRRMHAVVDFPMPEAEYRLRIWEVHFPADAPCEELDLEFLAQRFKIAGGNIRNIVLGAAFLAAEDEQPIKMKYLTRAARRELQKMGRLVREQDFGKYYQYIDGGDGHASKTN